MKKKQKRVVYHSCGMPMTVIEVNEVQYYYCYRCRAKCTWEQLKARGLTFLRAWGHA